MKQLVAVGGALVLVASVLIAASMVWPGTVPRLAFLPEPAQSQREVDCNTATRYWERDGLFWASEEFTTLVACDDVADPGAGS